MSDTSRIYHERYRPQYHFTPRLNWTNDPNGLVYYAGEYHLFFQHNPYATSWGNMTWGHAVSPDLLHWVQLDPALLPDRLGTMFSGSAVVDWENTAGFRTGREDPLIAIYTAAGDTSPESQGQPFTQCIAFSNDRGRTWTKYAGNPVLPHIGGRNRDPKVIWHAESRRWIMALFLDGSEYALFSSKDLKSWSHLQNVTLPGCRECPDFFDVSVEGEPGERRWVFTGANGNYLVGQFDGRRFRPETDVQVGDWGANFYAVQTYSDIPTNDGRRIQIAWMAKGQYPDMPFNQQMSFPCFLTLHRAPAGLRLHRQPVHEIAKLRAGTETWTDQLIGSGHELFAGDPGDCLEIEAAFEPGTASEIGLQVRGETIVYEVAKRKLSCLGRSASLEPNARRINLHVLLDRTSIEVFASEGAVSMSSCFVPDPAATGLRLLATGGEARLVELRVHRLASIWP